jgi:hypothetical protein
MGIMARQFKPGQLRPGVLYDITASYAVQAGTTVVDRIVSGPITASVQQTDNIFLITSASTDLFAVSSSGVVVFATQSAELTNPAPNGGIYFTSSSFFVGLD